MAEEQQQEPKTVHGMAYVFYYLVLFFAYWFGSARFDVDGDGDFDPEDVQAWLQDHGVLHKNYTRSASKGAKGGKSGTSLGENNKAPAKAPAKAPEKKPEDPEKATSPGGGSMFDRDGDGDVDFYDLVETKVDGDAQEDLAMKALVTGQVKPWFIIIECTVCFGLWLIWSLVNGGDSFLETKAGFDSFFEEKTDLRFYTYDCDDVRWQFWRWFTYQWTHVGIVHVMMNVFLNIILGIPLEGSHGFVRMFLMFNSGVFGGALANMLYEGRSVVVGCSGGCYSLIGIHLADLMMNWHQKKFRLPTLVLILLLITVDTLAAFASAGDGHVSHTAHIGGGTAGLLVGIVIGKNMKMMAWEKCFIGTAVFLCILFTLVPLIWLFAQTHGPQSIFEAMAGDEGYCWTHQIYNFTPSDPSNNWANKWYCIKCGTKECIAHFTTNVIQKGSVDFDLCETNGWFDHPY